MPSGDDPHNSAFVTTAETSLDLLRRAQAGDADALNTLAIRYVPRMLRWATGRLPRGARGMTDTHDLVQDCVSQAFRRIDQFEIRGEGALQAYLRQTLLNQIRHEIRRASRRPSWGQADVEQLAVEDPTPSPLEQAIGSEALERYEKALARLRSQDREAIVTRIELGFSYEEVAEALSKPSANAARMAVQRALVRLVTCMNQDPPYR